MKKLLKSFISFTRTERMGLLGLLLLLMLLIAVRATMPLWVHRPADTEKEKQLVASWETFKRSLRNETDTIERTKNDYQDAFDDNQTPLPAIVNLNTADSATLVRFKGIGPATAGRIVERRKNKGLFTNINQLREVGSFSDATFEVLKKHLSIGTE